MRDSKQDELVETGEGRAQPGDVIGIETGGEQTHIGEDREDEDERREEAEEEAEEETRKEEPM